ncbi:hypothetical protein [Parendozoicomonas sp. Alg238-R29]|uniref:hypothetical protein n=1 Tax=Parendozoicomonas sp. Alg238-R29 TaxID=2993446 RepID=UPI00248E5C33|nr:hypothetical protein [Parendozoicomonas sp. Alg238-R29]
MDGQNRSVSPRRFARPSTLRRGTLVERGEQPPLKRSPSRRWSHSEAPVQSHFAKHPMVFRLQLQQAISSRVVTRLREMQKNTSFLTALMEQGNNVSESETLEIAKKHALILNDLSDETTDDDELQYLLESLLHGNSLHPDKKKELKSLLRALVDETPEALATQEGVEEFSTLMKEYTPRALAIFLSTGFGSYVLECFKTGEPLSNDDRIKMGKGLLQIKARLNARASHLPDSPLIEYANLFMGEDINLSTPEHTVPIVMDTLESIREQHEESLQVAEEFKEELSSENLERHLPIALKKIDQLRMQDLERSRRNEPGSTHPVVNVARHIDNHPELRVLLKDEQLSVADLKEVTSHLKTLMTNDQKAVEGLKILENKVANLPEEKDDLSDTLLVELRKILEEAAKLTNSRLNSQTLNLLRDQIDSQILNRTKARFEKEFYRQLRFLEKGGSEKTFTVSIDVGGAASIAGISGISVGAKLEYTFKVTGNDDTKIIECHIVKPSLSVTGGDDKVISAAIEAGTAHSSGRIFQNLEDFVQFRSNDLVPMLMGTLSHVAANTKGSIDSRRARNLQQKVTADGQLLSQRLAELGVIHPGDQIRVSQDRRVNYANFKQHAFSTSLKVKALAGVIKSEVAIQNKATHFKTKTNLLYMLRNNPDKAAPPKKHRKYISFMVPASPIEELRYYDLKLRSGISSESVNPIQPAGDADTSSDTQEPEDRAVNPLTDQEQILFSNFKEEDGVISLRKSSQDAATWMDEQAETLKDLREKELELNQNPDSEISFREQTACKEQRLAIREVLKKAMVDQFIERDMYYFTVNAMEGRVGEESSQTPFHTAKHSLQKVYGAKDRGEFIAAHIYSFFHLHQLYKDTFLPGETPEGDDPVFNKVLQDNIEPSLDTPQLSLKDNKHVRQSLTAASVAKSTEKTASMKLSLVIPKTNVGISADIKHSIIGKHVNPDNDGNYFTFGLNINSGSTTTALAMKTLQAAIEKTKGRNSSEDSDIPEFALSALSELIPQMSSLSIEAGMRIECHLVKRHKGWRLQFTRILANDSIGFSAPDSLSIPTGPIGSVNLGASASIASVHNWWEQPGNNTLTYIYAKYNGWRGGHMQKIPAWSAKPEEFDKLTKQDGGNPLIRYTTQHKQAISELLANLGKDGMSINQEFYEMLGQIDESVPPGYIGFTEMFARMIDEHARNPSTDNLPKILPEFERFMAMQYEVYLKEARSRYKPHFRKGVII